MKNKTNNIKYICRGRWLDWLIWPQCHWSSNNRAATSELLDLRTPAGKKNNSSRSLQHVSVCPLYQRKVIASAILKVLQKQVLFFVCLRFHILHFKLHCVSFALHDCPPCYFIEQTSFDLSGAQEWVSETKTISHILTTSVWCQY